MALDITSADSIAAAAQAVSEAVGSDGLAGLVNNAGIVVSGPLELIPITALREQFEVNVFGQLAVTQAFLPLIRLGQGRIVMLGSAVAGLPLPFAGPYSASKNALRTLTRVLRVELSRWDIPVSLVVPSGVSTPIWERAALRMRRLSESYSPEARAMYGLDRLDSPPASGGTTGPKRLPPEAVAVAVAHALSARRPRARYVLGANARLVEAATRLPFVELVFDWWLARAVRHRSHTL